jgi:hypothetical protein
MQLDPYDIRSLIGMMQSTVASTAIQLGLMDKRKSSSRKKLHGMHRSRSTRLERTRPLREETDRHVEGDAIHEAQNHDGEPRAHAEDHNEDIMRKTHSLPEEALRRELLRRRKLSREGGSNVSMGPSSLRSSGRGTRSCDSRMENSHRPALLDLEWLCLPYYFIQGFFELTVRAGSEN